MTDDPPNDASGGQADGGTPDATVASSSANAPTDGAPSDSGPSDSGPSDSGPVVTNSVSTSPQNPVVRPRVRNIRQYDDPWGSQSVRRDGQRNITGQITWRDSWTGNGCFPTAMAIVMNWWANYHGPTKGQLTWPKSGATPTAGSGLTPPDLCQMTGGDAYADCYGSKISDEDYKDKGFNNTAHVEYKVTASNVISGIGATTAPAGSDTPAMMRVRYDLTGSADNKTSLIKQYLHFGPVLVMISYPGHWVVIDAYVDTKIYICDPGAVMASNGKYYATGGTPVPAGDLPSGATAGQAYYIIDATATMTSKKGKSLGKWLDLLRTMDIIYVPDPHDSDDPGNEAHVNKPYYPHQDFDVQAPMNQDDTSSGGTGSSAADPGTPATGSDSATSESTPAASDPGPAPAADASGPAC